MAARACLPGASLTASRRSPPQRTPISHKVIEKRRRDRINRCLNELGKTVPMALAKQVLRFHGELGSSPRARETRGCVRCQLFTY
ncbi:hypothetical protein Z043_124698 [Scleropages formosus]|uniref:BHLH domain-containing protein n=1 Tax=Scleropages formosus TaxID=113540 RepID=A0A0P7TV68_SCLFO|nr:hypothetical protein Z043_124698 [Scleropages formosus]